MGFITSNVGTYVSKEEESSRSAESWLQWPQYYMSFAGELIHLEFQTSITCRVDASLQSSTHSRGNRSGNLRPGNRKIHFQAPMELIGSIQGIFKTKGDTW